MKRKAEKNEEERGRGKRKKEREREREREKSTNIGLVCGSHKQLKNIEWWQVSDGAKQVGYFKVMSNEWLKLSDEKKASKQALNLLTYYPNWIFGFC